MRLPTPKLELVHNWRDVMRHAWSLRLMALATLLTFLEVVISLVGVPLPLGPRAVVMGLVTAGAFASRLLAQKQFQGGDDERK